MDPVTMALLISLGATLICLLISEYLGSHPDSKYKSILLLVKALLEPIAKKVSGFKVEKIPEEKK